MDVGLLRRVLGSLPQTAAGLRDRALVSLLVVSAASDGRLTQGRALALRVGEVTRALEGLPHARAVVGVVRNLATAAGLTDDDPVLASRKRGADGTRRPVSRVQAYRILRARAGGGWASTVRRLGAGTRPSAAVAPRPAAPPPRPTHPLPTHPSRWRVDLWDRSPPPRRGGDPPDGG